MKRSACWLSAVALAAAAATPSLAQSLYSIDRATGDLYELDASDASFISATSLDLPGKVVLGGAGLAFHPGTSQLYALLDIELQAFPELVTIDIGSGTATSIGVVSDQFTGISFSEDGTLYGVTSDDATVPEALYELNTTDASSSFLMLLDDAGSGEAIAVHRPSNRLYRASDIIGGHLYQRINLGTMSSTDIPVSGDDYFEAQAMTWAGGNQFYLSDLDGNVYLMSTTGNAQYIGTIGLRGGGGGGPGEEFISKGLAYVVPIPEPGSLLLLGVAGTMVVRRRR